MNNDMSAEKDVRFASTYLYYQVFAASGHSFLGMRDMAPCGQATRHTPHPKQCWVDIYTLRCADE